MPTPNFGLRFPVVGDTPDVVRDITYLATDADTALQSHEVRLDAADAYRKPMCKIQSAADFALPHNITTVLDFASGATPYDTNAMADIANDQIVIKTAGYYRLSAFVPYPSNATGYRVTLIRVNGAIIEQDYRGAVSGTITTATITSEPLLLAVNDTISLACLQNSGSSLSLVPGNGVRFWLAAVFESAA